MENKTNLLIKGNENTQQNINTQINYNVVGITENDVREISYKTSSEICAQYATLSASLINSRLDSFEHLVFERLDKVEHSINSFGDPGFVWQYKQAQIQAAISGTESDYNLLCELLVRRTQKKEDKYNQTGIDGAIKIVDELSDSSLTALTILCCVIKCIRPTSFNVDEGLATIDKLYQSIIQQTPLPNGYNWMDQLDILRAIRINTLSQFPSFKEAVPQIFKNYIALGIKKGTEKYTKALDIQKALNINILQENQLNDNYVKLPFQKDDISKLIIQPINLALSSIDSQLKEIFDLYDTDTAEQEKLNSLLCNKLKTYHYISLVSNWWDKIPHACEITSVGMAIAHANAKRCYSEFPDLD